MGCPAESSDRKRPAWSPCGPCTPCQPVCPERKRRYVQPQKPQPCYPQNNIVRATDRFAQDTVYRKSYLPVDGRRPDAVVPPTLLCCGTGRMAHDTIQKLSFPEWPCPVPRTGPVLPCDHHLIGKGPMQDITTTKHDYVPKPYSKEGLILPYNHLCNSQKPLEDKTTFRLSYLPHSSVCRTQPIFPTQTLTQGVGKISNLTTQKLSYLPNEIRQKEYLPWAHPPPYQTPTIRMQGDTIYNKSYIRNDCVMRTRPIMPNNTFHGVGSGRDFSDSTIYRKSYQVNCGARAEKIVPPSSLCTSNARMDDKTIQKLSFPGWTGIKPPCLIPPCDHYLGGQGPMQDITTQKHDFVPKPYTKPCVIVPANHLCNSTAPLSELTTNRLSYVPQCPVPVTKPIKRPELIMKGQGRMEDKTIQKLSYLPNEIKAKEYYPWADKGRFIQPTCNMEDCTTYKLSYFPPGQYIDECDPCCPCPPADPYPKAGIPVC